MPSPHPPPHPSPDPAQPAGSTGQALGSLRIVDAVVRGACVNFVVDGESVDAFAGESVAAALYARGQRTLRHSPGGQSPRGMFCMMGSCQECLVWCGSRKLPACQLPVAAGLVVETLQFRERQHG